MPQLKSWAVLLTVFASVLSLSAQSQKHEIVLDLSLPNGETPQLRVAEGGTGTVELPDVGKFGFVPTLRDSNPGTVVVELFDLNGTPDRRIATLEAIVGGERVQTTTTPEFGVRVARVLTR